MDIDKIYDDYWICLPAATTAANRASRRITTFTKGSGTLTWDRALSGATIPDSAAYELHGLLPMEDWTTAFNDALKLIMVATEITLTPTASAKRHDITTANTWLTNPAWIRQIGYLQSNETRANESPYTSGRLIRGWADTDGATVYINHPTRTVASGETWYLRVVKPAYYHCTATGGLFGSQSGLSAESDEAPVDADYLAWAGMAMAFSQGRLDFGSDADPQLQGKRQEAIRMASRYAREFDPTQREDTTLKFTKANIHFGPLGFRR